MMFLPVFLPFSPSYTKFFPSVPLFLALFNSFAKDDHKYKFPCENFFYFTTFLSPHLIGINTIFFDLSGTLFALF